MFSSFSDYAKKENKLLMYIGDFNKQLDYLYKLIKIINVQNLTQVKLLLTGKLSTQDTLVLYEGCRTKVYGEQIH